MKAGDIILVKGKNPISLLVRFFTNSVYSHVALAISENYVLEIDATYTLQIRKNNYTCYDVYRLKRELLPSELSTLLRYAHSLIGKKYDFMRIFSLVFELSLHLRGKKIFDDSNKLICSDLIDSSYKQINVDLIPQYKHQDTTPVDISKSQELFKAESKGKDFIELIKNVFSKENK